MKKPKITFMMIAYNSENTINRAVKSILNQTEREINLIVRNNGSEDRTGEYLNEAAKTDPRLHVVENKVNWKDKEGRSFTSDGVIRIWSVENTELLGEYISIVDSDDWLSPEFASKMYHAAKTNDADMTICGNEFMADENKSVGVRLPPVFSANGEQEIGRVVQDRYPELHNSLRTWWGKLFKTEFFRSNYDDVWKAVGGKNGDVLDTAVMLRYLCKAKSIVGVADPLYKFYRSPGSTYSIGRPVNFFRVLEADELFTQSLDCLKNFKAGNANNIHWLCRIHWVYLCEAMDTLRYPHEGFSAQQELSGLAALGNSAVLPVYYQQSINKVYQKLMQSVESVMTRRPDDRSLYTSYLTRLYYIQNELHSGNRSLLLYPIWCGCLYDRENRNKIGYHLLQEVTSRPFADLVAGACDYQAKEMHSCVSCPAFWPDSLSIQKKTALLEARLIEAFHRKNFDDFGKLYEKIMMTDPLNRTAIYYFIKLMQLSHEKNTVLYVLAGTGIALWPADREMQSLCWSVLANGEKEVENNEKHKSA
ncbi:MAG: glycosyltransferase [Oscillospiraceae bacterium]|nr:glycosyltransferase [Oscillospiraceae bacterium]